MRNKWAKIAALLLIGIFLLQAIPACQRVEAADSYVAILPKVLHSGRTEAISLAVFAGNKLAKDNVEVAFLKDGKKLASSNQAIDGKGTVLLDIPKVEDGKYEIQVKGGAFSDKASISVEKSFLVFVETDKPIYKPGQTIHMRVLTLDPELKPTTEPVTVDIMDAKGIKIFHSVVTTDDYGMASVDLPLSDEPNLGVWKINVITDKAKNQLDVRVEEYVLPKYEVTVDLPSNWFLVSEPIKGTIGAEYSFGKPVKGEVEIIATKYVGQWQQYATMTKTIDGQIDFELPAAQYVAGTPASGGQGNVQLDITVTEKSTGYVEKTSRLLTVAQTGVNLQLIPEGSVFKPGLPFNVLVLSETPDNRSVDAKVSVTITYMNAKFEDFKTDEKELSTIKGKALLELAPPAEAIALMIEARSGDAYATKTLQSSYSPSGNFIHLEQTTDGAPKVGQKISFRVFSTDRAVNFYYEVLSRGTVVFSDYTTSRDITFSTTPLMAPVSKLLVYQILPNAEVAADYLPFKVEAAYPQRVTAEFSKEEAGPAEEIQLNIKTDGRAKVGIAAVDKSVFILAENRLNLQQVFDELERLYMEPQAEIHEVSFYPSYTVPGAQDIFKDAGVVVMTNKKVPESQEYKAQGSGGIMSKIARFFGIREVAVPVAMEAEKAAMPTPAPTNGATAGGLAEVQRVRQFFPETWLWDVLETDASGKVTQQVTVPDSITTWMLRAVAISKEKGLGVGEDSLRVFQPFFLTIDLPYSVIRGEEFPVQVAVYNYIDTAQSVQVDIEKGDWFDLLDDTTKTIDIAANDIGGVEFMIRPTQLGIKDVKITARSIQAADAVIKTVIIEPEGVPREIIDNITLAGGITRTIDTSVPDVVVSDSGRAYIAVTSSFLTQTIDGLDALLQMPFGCGEQNMIVFAPDVYITKYLQSSGQLKPEIMAKAEKLMITGYQRELTYRRTDGSFSAFGMNDESGSLWLTSFVLKCFSQAKGLLYIDDSVLDSASNWITSHQNTDGSFDAVGFVHHQDMLGGLKGKEALTAYTAIALMEAGEKNGSGKAIRYLEGKLSEMTDPYAVAITTYALELANSSKKEDAYNKLMSLAIEDESGLHWSSGNVPVPVPEVQQKAGKPVMMAPFRPDINKSADIETTAYATLALVKYGDAFNASRASKWLVSKRNSYGGYGSTQDTVVTLQALTEYATGARSDVDLTVILKGEEIDKQLTINKDNFDVLQLVPVPVNATIDMTVTGRGDAIGQVVRRFNLPAVEETPAAQMLKIDVKYDTTEVAVNDLVKVSVSLAFNPLPELNISEAGMIVLDVSVPTGFAPVTESIVAVTEKMENIKRYDVAGRKVIFYVENMKPGQQIVFDFQVKALYPVKAKGVTSTAYSYYRPDIKGETLGAAVTVQ